MELETVRLSLPINPKRDHIQGPPTAPLNLLEYGDYECPYCGQAYTIIKEVQKDLGENLCFAFRNFPLTQIHPHAQSAAEAAEAAGEQKKFWEMHDCLYENQPALDDEYLVEYARLLGLDISRFEYDLSKHTYAPRIHEDFISGVRSGVNGTPTFYINGIRYNGSWDLDALLETLHLALEDV